MISSLATQHVPADQSNYAAGRIKPIRCITIHHMAGVMSADACGRIFAQAGIDGSSHYGIGNDGEIASYVDENNTAWTNSNYYSNAESITIEVSNSSIGGDWPVSNAAYNSLIKLVADIAKRNNLGILTPGVNLTWHRMFVATSCPGKYLLNHMQDIADSANHLNNSIPVLENRKSDDQLADEAIAGAWGNGDERKRRLTEAGYDYYAVQTLVNKKLGFGYDVANNKTAEVSVGDKVTLGSWVDYNGIRLAKTRDFYFVSEISGDRTVLRADSVDGAVYAAVNKNNLRSV